MPKVHQNTFDGRTRWRSLCAPADPLAAIGGLLLLLRGDGKEGREERGTENEGREFPPKSR